MSGLPRISEAEWLVMEAIWAADRPLLAAEVVEQLEEATKWSHRTVRTLLNRLVKKKVLTYRADGNRYLYSAKRPRQDYVQEESSSFLDRVFAGDADSLLMHFVERSSLSKRKLKELRKLLDEED
ncbi:MAG: BlaI/MecI/CopY family transcriptional regulator [Pirellulaceae bacterium]|nr:BlaI/MecI/CopY family transcriptional regulator [Pirellulaceae bacterium]MDP7017058.1 BlaI/MecI/CopY family transcriptional regulator [Pirellulaceae bacterium]